MEKVSKRILSGVQPSGDLHLGNYLGAIKNFVSLQKEFECFFCVVDLHAITVWQDPKILKQKTREVAAAFIASGIDPEKNTLFVQSQVPQHAQLAWIFNCVARMGWLNRMTQFKDKAGKNSENVSVGLFSYPTLMAADILIYLATHVPVGEDQKQHLELSRDIAIRFNSNYSDTFKIPEPYIPKEGARIMSLQDPLKKMSKSDLNLNNIVSMLDSPDVVKKKIKRAVTDSGSKIKQDSSSPGISNLLQLHSLVTGIKISELEKEFEGKMYSNLKNALIDSLNEFLKPIQAEYNRISADKIYLSTVLKEGADNAFYRARKTLNKVYRKVGFLPK